MWGRRRSGIRCACELSERPDGTYLQRELSRSLNAASLQVGGLSDHDARQVEYYIAWRAWSLTFDEYFDRKRRDSPTIPIWRPESMSSNSPEVLAEFYGGTVAEWEEILEDHYHDLDERGLAPTSISSDEPKDDDDGQAR